MNLGKVSFSAGKCIDDLINELHAVQVTDNRLSDDSIDDDHEAALLEARHV